MEKCTECGVKYPDGYLAPIMTSDGHQAGVCGICALAISNAVLGIERTEFQGETAEDMRQDAIEWRKKQGIKI